MTISNAMIILGIAAFALGFSMRDIIQSWKNANRVLERTRAEYDESQRKETQS